MTQDNANRTILDADAVESSDQELKSRVRQMLRERVDCSTLKFDTLKTFPFGSEIPNVLNLFSDCTSPAWEAVALKYHLGFASERELIANSVYCMFVFSSGGDPSAVESEMERWRVQNQVSIDAFFDADKENAHEP